MLAQGHCTDNCTDSICVNFQKYLLGNNQINPMAEIVEKVSCPSCGAPLKIKAGELVIICEYCGTAVNLKAEKPFLLKHSIIPNNYSEEEIQNLVRAWMRSGYAMPENLARRARIKQARLVFLPFYVVTVHAATDYEGVFTRTGGQRRVKDTITGDYQWIIVGRRSTQFPEREYRIPLSGKASFDLSLVQGEFLNAEIDEDEAQERARTEIEAHHNYLMKEKVDEVAEVSTTIDVENCEFLHAPIWFIDYEYQRNVYHVIIDGSTGQVIKGDIPVEESTFPWTWIAAIVAIILLLFLLFI